jgi:thioredoxin reductase/SAM-dependent methyltransferase
MNTTRTTDPARAAATGDLPANGTPPSTAPSTVSDTGIEPGAAERYDVAVVGGGAAGLSAALTLTRARRTVLVVDAGEPRNAPAGHVHNYLAREGAPPAELLAAGRAEVAGYGGRFRSARVTAVEAAGGVAGGDDGGGEHGFRLLLSDGGIVRARRLLVATGLVDELPDVPGLAQRWGRDVLHCPYCHGWEVRDQPIAVLATGPMAMHQVQLFRQWSADVTLLLHAGAGPTSEEREQLAARDIRVVSGPVTGLEVTGDQLSGVRLADGGTVACRALVVAPRFLARADMLTGLGLETADFRMGDHVLGTHVPADATGATAVPGVWVAGNVTDPSAQVIGAAAAGVRAAAALNADLVAADFRAAVAARAAARRHHPRPAPTPSTGHEHVPGEEPPGSPVESAETFWDRFYTERPNAWSGAANAALVRVAADLPAGAALDLGCGEGGDAIWLAQRGWRVTAADISATALQRAAEHASSAGVGDRVDWQRHDLAESFPAGSFDLVSAQFLHSPVELPRAQILRAAARAVAPGGCLLVVGHAGPPPWAPDACGHVTFPTPEEVLAALDLPPADWQVQRADSADRQAVGPDGSTATLTDRVLMVRRHGGGEGGEGGEG